MKKTVLITGANGEVAKKLAEMLKDQYFVRFLTRKRTEENEFEWNIEDQTIDENALSGVNHIIHLAGAGIVDKPWTEKRKELILSSRIDSAKLILNTLKKQGIKIDSFISASATGYYGSQTSERIYSEEDLKGNGFLSEVCFRWEKATDEFLIEKVAERVVKMRIGVVLSDAKNGFLERIKKPVSNYSGTCLGSGKQYIPWVHIHDLCAIFKFCLENENTNGAYNAVSPESATNKEITQTISRILNKPIILPNIPDFVIKWIFGEAADMLLEGSRVSSSKIQQAGFHFQYPELEKAMENLLK